MTLPSELLELNQWTHSASDENLKVPAYTKYEPDGALPYTAAAQIALMHTPNLLKGMYVTLSDPYILGDIDGIKDPNNPFPELPPELAYLLKSKKTYSEISPSGNGIRFVLKFISIAEKEKLRGKVFHTCELPPDKKKGIQVNIAGPWMTITGNPTQFSTPRIAVVAIDELKNCFNLKLERVKSIVKKEEVKKAQDESVEEVISIPFSKLRSEVLSLSLDKNPRIQRAYEKVMGCAYDHYDYWTKVLMALRYYALLSGKELECLELAVQWSSNDPDDYVDEEDVIKHWESFSKEDINDTVTHKTIFKLGFYNTLRWPVPKLLTAQEKDYNVSPKPLTTEYQNFKALIDFYNLKIHSNYLEDYSYFITGDKDILDSAFKTVKLQVHYEKYYGPISLKSLIPLFHMFLQAHGFIGIGHNRIQEFIKNWIIVPEGEVNLMKQYFDTPYHELPESYQDNPQNYESSTFDVLFNCIKIDYRTTDHKKERQLYYRYYKCWLMGLVRGLYYTGPYNENNCILLLTGLEQKRKSSHFRALLPPFLKQYIANTTHDFSSGTSLRDIIKLATDNLIIVWDELEKYITGVATESQFKNMIDNKPTKYIDKWEVNTSVAYPKAIYGATSNRDTFRIGNKGSRRLFHIPITWIDTDTMESLCWHPIITKLKEEMFEGLKKKGRLPWLLTSSELQYQAELHTGLRSKSELEYLLREVYDFDSHITYTKEGGIDRVRSFRDDKTGRLKSIKQILHDLSMNGINIHKIKLSALRYTLELLCSEYTKTQRSSRDVKNPKCYIYRGVAHQGNRTLYVMPKLISSAQGNANERAEEIFRDFT